MPSSAVADQQREAFGAVQIGLQDAWAHRRIACARSRPLSCRQRRLRRSRFPCCRFRHRHRPWRRTARQRRGGRCAFRSRHGCRRRGGNAGRGSVSGLLSTDRPARLAPSLFDLGEVEAFEPDRTLGGLVAGRVRPDRVRPPGRTAGSKRITGSRRRENRRDGSTWQAHGKRVLSAFDSGRIAGYYSMPPGKMRELRIERLSGRL